MSFAASEKAAGIPVIFRGEGLAPVFMVLFFAAFYTLKVGHAMASVVAMLVSCIFASGKKSITLAASKHGETTGS